MPLYFRNVGTAWNNNTSWSTTSSTGPSSGSIPTLADDVIFDVNSAATCPVSTTVGFCRDITTTGWTGTITLNVDLSVQRNHVLSSTTTINGTAFYCANGTGSITSNTILFPNFKLNRSSGTFTLTLNDVLNVINIVQDFNGAVTNGFSVNVNGNMVFANTNVAYSGTTIYNLVGTGNLGYVNVTSFYSCTININTTGTITFLSGVHINTGTLTYIAGNVITTGSTVLFNGTNSVTSKNLSTGNEILFNNINASTGGPATTTTLNNDIIVLGNFTVSNFNGHNFNGGKILVSGNIVNPTTLQANGGTSIMEMVGSNPASITNVGATPSSATGILSRSLTINKSGGATVTLIGNLSLLATGRTYQVSAGIFNPSSSTITLGTGINSTFNSFTFFNLTIPGASTITQNTANTIQNNLTLGSNGNVAFDGTAGWTCANLFCTTSNRTITLQNSVTYRTTTGVQLVATAAQPITMISNNSSVRAIWTLDYGATQNIIYVNGTRIDSSGGQTIWTFGGIISTTPVGAETLNWRTGTRPGTIVYVFLN